MNTLLLSILMNQGIIMQILAGILDKKTGDRVWAYGKKIVEVVAEEFEKDGDKLKEFSELLNRAFESGEKNERTKV